MTRVSYWPTMVEDVVDYVRDCHLCVARRPLPTPHSHPFHVPDLQSEKGEKVFVDIVGPLIASNQGNTVILTIMDGFSRYLKAYPLPNKLATSIVSCIEDWVNTWGPPQVLHSDHGTEFRPRQLLRKEGNPKNSIICGKPCDK